MHQVKLMHVLSDEHVCLFEYIYVMYTLVYLPACVRWYVPVSICRYLRACIFYFGWSWAVLLTASQGHVTSLPVSKTAV